MDNLGQDSCFGIKHYGVTLSWFLYLSHPGKFMSTNKLLTGGHLEGTTNLSHSMKKAITILNKFNSSLATCQWSIFTFKLTQQITSSTCNKTYGTCHLLQILLSMQFGWRQAKRIWIPVLPLFSLVRDLQNHLSIKQQNLSCLQAERGFTFVEKMLVMANSLEV